jgi:hypothetical protein
MGEVGVDHLAVAVAAPLMEEAEHIPTGIDASEIGDDTEEVIFLVRADGSHLQASYHKKRTAFELDEVPSAVDALWP